VRAAATVEPGREEKKSHWASLRDERPVTELWLTCAAAPILEIKLVLWRSNAIELRR